MTHKTTYELNKDSFKVLKLVANIHGNKLIWPQLRKLDIYVRLCLLLHHGKLVKIDASARIEFRYVIFFILSATAGTDVNCMVLSSEVLSS